MVAGSNPVGLGLSFCGLAYLPVFDWQACLPVFDWQACLPADRPACRQIGLRGISFHLVYKLAEGLGIEGGLGMVAIVEEDEDPFDLINDLLPGADYLD